MTEASPQTRVSGNANQNNTPPPKKKTLKFNTSKTARHAPLDHISIFFVYIFLNEQDYYIKIMNLFICGPCHRLMTAGLIYDWLHIR